MDEDYEEKCSKILEIDSIRFAALIDSSGKIIVGGLREGLDLKLSTEELGNVLKEIAIRVSKRKKHDDELGRVKYSASRREDVVIMSFPIFDNSLVIVAEPNINIDRISWQIIQILGKQWSSFVGE